jgi:hypothetical protein
MERFEVFIIFSVEIFIIAMKHDDHGIRQVLSHFDAKNSSGLAKWRDLCKQHILTILLLFSLEIIENCLIT